MTTALSESSSLWCNQVATGIAGYQTIELDSADDGTVTLRFPAQPSRPVYQGTIDEASCQFTGESTWSEDGTDGAGLAYAMTLDASLTLSFAGDALSGTVEYDLEPRPNSPYRDDLPCTATLSASGTRLAGTP